MTRWEVSIYTRDDQTYYGIMNTVTLRRSYLDIPVDSIENLDLINNIISLLNKSFDEGQSAKALEVSKAIHHLKSLLDYRI